MKLFKRIKQFARKQLSFTLSGYTGGLNTSWSLFNSNNAFTLHRELAWIYACVNLRASAIASVPWIVEKKKGDGWETDKTHELNRLLARPNNRIDQSTMFKFTVQHLDLQGNAYWLKTRRTDQGSILELWPTTPAQLNPVLVNGILQRYLKANGNKVDIEDVVHLTYTNPESIYIGLSPMQAAMRAADIDKEAGEWQKNSLENRAVPDGVMTIEDIETREQFEDAKKRLKEQYQGKENARLPIVMGGKSKWTPMSLTAAEMDFIESRKMTREEILAVYGVPHPMVGVYDKATLANIQTARKIFWRDTIIPVLSEIESGLNLQLAWQEYGDDIRIRYDVSGIEAMRDSYTENVINAKGLWSMGLPFNVINKRLELGFDEIEGGDVGYLSGGLIPTDMEFDLTTEDMSKAEDLAKLAYGKNK